MKKLSFLTVMIAFLVLAIGGVTYSCPYVYVEMAGSTLQFEREGWTTVIKFSTYPGQVTGASYASDPIIGKYQVMYIPSHPTQYDYKLEREISPGVWSLSNEASVIALSATADPRYSTNYLTGTATALTIDFNTGTIQWTTVQNLTALTANLPSSQVLKDFSNYSTGNLTYSFSVTDELKRWLSDQSQGCIYNTTYWTTLSAGPTGVPEPQAWVLLMLGVGLLWMYRGRLKFALERSPAP
jgi:hypothetical protein